MLRCTHLSATRPFPCAPITSKYNPPPLLPASLVLCDAHLTKCYPTLPLTPHSTATYLQVSAMLTEEQQYRIVPSRTRGGSPRRHHAACCLQPLPGATTPRSRLGRTPRPSPRPVAPRQPQSWRRGRRRFGGGGGGGGRWAGGGEHAAEGEGGLKGGGCDGKGAAVGGALDGAGAGGGGGWEQQPQVDQLRGQKWVARGGDGCSR